MGAGAERLWPLLLSGQVPGGGGGTRAPELSERLN